jgi:1-acyl-sn-glycerol-3-phosphate acyltransferase
MRLILKPFLFLYFIYALITFLLIMFLIFPFALLGSFLARIRGGNLIYRLCRLWGDCWFFLVFIRPKLIYEVPHDRSKPYLFVSNHLSYLDAAFIVKVFRQPLRPLGNVEMSKIPVFGFIYKKAIVSVDRSNPRNRAQSILILRSVIKKGISVLVFPEGTFNMTNHALKQFYDGAFRVAIETETPIKPVLFLDTYDRLNYKSVFSLNPGRCRAVYLEEIPVKGRGIDGIAQLREEVYSLMEKKLREYGASWINEAGPAKT